MKIGYTEYHVVETVAHTKAAEKYIDGVSFILDIGGQDMKAVWVDNGVVTNIVVNEACPSGCGSFLENFASALNITVDQIAEKAFSSSNPAVLGSRCTVFYGHPDVSFANIENRLQMLIMNNVTAAENSTKKTGSSSAAV